MQTRFFETVEQIIANSSSGLLVISSTGRSRVSTMRARFCRYRYGTAMRWSGLHRCPAEVFARTPRSGDDFRGQANGHALVPRCMISYRRGSQRWDDTYLPTYLRLNHAGEREVSTRAHQTFLAVSCGFCAVSRAVRRVRRKLRICSCSCKSFTLIQAKRLLASDAAKECTLELPKPRARPRTPLRSSNTGKSHQLNFSRLGRCAR